MSFQDFYIDISRDFFIDFYRVLLEILQNILPRFLSTFLSGFLPGFLPTLFQEFLPEFIKDFLWRCLQDCFFFWDSSRDSIRDSSRDAFIYYFQTFLREILPGFVHEYWDSFRNFSRDHRFDYSPDCIKDSSRIIPAFLGFQNSYISSSWDCPSWDFLFFYPSISPLTQDLCGIFRDV